MDRRRPRARSSSAFAVTLAQLFGPRAPSRGLCRAHVDRSPARCASPTLSDTPTSLARCPETGRPRGHRAQPLRPTDVARARRVAWTNPPLRHAAPLEHRNNAAGLGERNGAAGGPALRNVHLQVGRTEAPSQAHASWAESERAYGTRKGTTGWCAVQLTTQVRMRAHFLDHSDCAKPHRSTALSVRWQRFLVSAGVLVHGRESIISVTGDVEDGAAAGSWTG